MALEHTMLKQIQDNVKYLSEIGQKQKHDFEWTSKFFQSLSPLFIK